MFNYYKTLKDIYLKAQLNINSKFENLKRFNLIEKEFQNKFSEQFAIVIIIIVNIKKNMKFQNIVINYPQYLVYNQKELLNYLINVMKELMIEQYFYQDLW